MELIEKIIDHQDNTKKEISNLFDTLVQKAFNGEIKWITFKTPFSDYY